MAKGKYVLVVDDDLDLVEAVAMNLESQGFEVGKAYDGIEAMESIGNRPAGFGCVGRDDAAQRRLHGLCGNEKITRSQGNSRDSPHGRG